MVSKLDLKAITSEFLSHCATFKQKSLVKKKSLQRDEIVQRLSAQQNEVSGPSSNFGRGSVSQCVLIS